jgi:hypothetical protein
MGWIGCIRCEKVRCDFMARNCALIAPVQPVLHRVSCCNEILPNAPEDYEKHQSMSFGSNGVDRVRSLRKKLKRIRGTIFCINYTSSARFAPSFVQSRNNPKCTQTLRNAAMHEFRVHWGRLGAFVAKISKTTSWHKLVH